MKYFGIEMEGKFKIQKVNSLPTYDFDRDEGRLVYSLDDNKFYYGDNEKWNRLADTDIIIGGENGINGSGTLGDDAIVLSPQYGTSANTICQGNDSRLSNAREWIAPTATSAEAINGTSTERRAWSPSRIKQMIELYSQAPVATVIASASSSTPSGYLICNGAAVSRSTYSSLFSAIGTRFGSGNGSTTFNIPDLRGEFIRGWDDGRGVDSGRSLGSFQADQFKSHNHNYTATNFSGHITRLTGGADSATHGTRATTNTGGNETRPRNIALRYYIKY